MNLPLRDNYSSFPSLSADMELAALEVRWTLEAGSTLKALSKFFRKSVEDGFADSV